jgi:MSHA type pilus biogenesis protein MshL
MGSFQRIVALVMGIFYCFFCCFSWAEDAQEQVWSVPMVQQVRMPAGIKDGVFYPQRDELVMVRPGAWGQLNKEDPSKELAPEVDQIEPLTVPVTFMGRVKLFDVLKIVAEVSGKVLVLWPGVQDSDVVLDVKDMPVSGALEHVLYPMGYGFKLNASDLLILARDTRMFRLNLPPVTQAFNTATTNESSSVSSGNKNSGDGRMRVGAKVMVENSSGGMSYWQDMEANVRSLMSSTGVLSLNKAAGVVVVSDAPRELDKIGVFFKDMNERASQQIIVDVKVVEVELSNEHKLGIDWGALLSSGDLKGLDLTTNFASENISSGSMVTFSGRMNKEGSGDTASGVRAVLKALESFGRIEVVSQPRVMMLNNSIASIQVGETRSYVESTNMETTQGGSTITTASLNEVHGGVTLQIVGSIVGEDVFLNVTPVVSTIDDIRTITLGGGNKLEAPDTSMKTMSTLVRVKAGRTVAIGGLITRDRSKHQYGIPFLSRLPVLGKAFSYELRRNNRTELVIFMTPRRG